MNVKRGQCGVDYLVSNEVAEFTQPLKDWREKEGRKIEGEKRGTVEERSEAVNCLSIQGEVGGEKRRGRRKREAMRKRGNMRRYNEREKGGGEKGDKDGE